MKIIRLKGNKPGFSLIEIMAVLVIVSLGILGLANLATQSIQAQTVNSNNIMAYQLAQEGIEIARQIRDTNWLQGRSWTTGLGTGTYCADYIQPALRPAAGLSQCPLYQDNQGWYRSFGAVPPDVVETPFRRVVDIEAATTTARVRSVVTWMERDRLFRYDTETILYDWR